MQNPTNPLKVKRKEIKLTDADVARFHSKIGPKNEDGCMLWLSGKHKAGYGKFSVCRKNHSAHRVSWVIANGDIPSGLCVCHRCDIPACCNPHHLFLGTHAENNADMVAKGRDKAIRGDQHYSRSRPELTAHGAAHYRTKLDNDKVRTIRNLYNILGLPQRQIARDFGINYKAVSMIITRKTWKHLP